MTCYAELLSRMKRLSWIIIVSQILTSVFAQNTTHTILRGETLYSVARQYSVTLDSLVKANNLSDPSSVQVGTILFIPQKQEPSLPLAVGYHTVMTGETYFGIAKKYNLSVEHLLAMNQRTSSTVLRVNEQLTVVVLPSSTDPPAPPLASDPPIAINPPAVGGGSSSTITQESVIFTPSTMQWPIRGEMRVHTGKQGGVQIHATGEERVKAVASGVVVFVGSFRELGNLVLVERVGGYLYIYGGLNMVLVKQGDSITPGTPLGMLFGNGIPLVFSVFKDSNVINPQTAPRD